MKLEIFINALKIKFANKNCSSMFLLLAIIVTSNVFASDRLFPAQLNTRLDNGFNHVQFIASKFEIPAMVTSPLTLNSNNSQIYLPAGTEFNLQTSTDFLTKPDSIGMSQKSYLDDLLERLKVMTFFDLMESRTSSNNQEASSSERKIYREKIRITDSPKKELKDKELEVEFTKEDLKKIKVVGDPEFPQIIESDFNGREDWDPNNSLGKKTEGSTVYDCSFCKKKGEDKAEPLLFKTKANLINKIFNNLTSPHDTEIKNKNNKAIQIAMKRAKGSAGLCYSYVKDALLSAGLTSKRLEGRLPRFSQNELNKEGFVNLLDKKQLKGTKFENYENKGIDFKNLIDHPNLAPKGAVLVYEPVDKNKMVNYCQKYKNHKSDPKYCFGLDAGHIEIKTADAGSGGFVSDYYHGSARTGNSMKSIDRVLVGVYYKM